MTMLATVLVCLLLVGDKPESLDWSMVPVAGDDDYPEKRRAILDKHKGMEVVITGRLNANQVTYSDRMLIVRLVRPARRGQLQLSAAVGIQFRDVNQRRIVALHGKTVTVIATCVESSPADVPVMFDHARITKAGR